MIQPQRIGRFIAVDERGYIRPDAAMENVQPAWKPLLAFVSHALMQRKGVHWVYVRGSIPRGLAIDYISDADFIYLADTACDRGDADLEAAATAAFGFVHGVKIFRLDRGEFDRVHHPQTRPYFHMLLKTQSLFLAGEDVARDIAPFKIGPDMVSHVFSLGNEFSKVSHWLAKVPRAAAHRHTSTSEKSGRQWISKRIVRSGFEITMDRSRCFTRDLYLCYEQFAKHYPQWAWQMFQVLINCLNGKENPFQYKELVALLTREGSRLLVLPDKS